MLALYVIDNYQFVLFSAIHYRGIPNGPNFQFVLDGGQSGWKHYFRDKNQESTEQEKLEDSWRLLIEQLRIYGCGEFEKQLIEFLQSGLLNGVYVQEIVAQLIDEKHALEAKLAAYDFMERAFWEHRLTNADLLTEAGKFVSSAQLLDRYVVTQLFDTVSKLPGGHAQGQEIIDAWISAFEAKGHMNVTDDEVSVPTFSREIHPLIKAVIDQTKTKALEADTLVEACLYIVTHRGWGPRQQAVMRSATIQEFEIAIRTMTTPDLRDFMPQMVRMCLDRETYDEHFGSAAEHFIAACRIVLEDHSVSRLGAIIKHFFTGNSLEAELTVKPIFNSLPGGAE